PVSTSRKRFPAHSQTSSLRSRVTPGVSWTTAARVAVSRLTSVDLPAFGKPTTATLPTTGCSGGLSLTDELFDPRDDFFHLQFGRVDLDRVLGRLHAVGIALVASAQVGREGVCADLR